MVEFTYNGILHKVESLMNTDVLIQRMGQYKTFYELNLLKKIASLNIGGVYIDGGANIGNHSIFFNHHCPSSKIYSIEIHPDIYNTLVKNLQNNTCKKCVPINIGLNDCEKNVELSELCETNIGMTHIVSENGNIPVKKLDDIIPEDEDVTLIKLDVEGYEKNVIIGSEKIIKRCKPIIIAEMSSVELFNDFNNEINKYGYQTDNINYGITPTYIWYPNK
jgi:FkbM family methyltransferase